MICVLRFLHWNLFWVLKLWGFHYVSHCERCTLLLVGWNYVYIWKGGGQVGIDLVYILYVFDSLFNLKDWLGLSMFECVYSMVCYVRLKVHLCPFESPLKKEEKESLGLRGERSLRFCLVICVKSQAYLEPWSMHGKVACNRTISSKIYHFDSHSYSIFSSKFKSLGKDKMKKKCLCGFHSSNKICEICVCCRFPFDLSFWFTIDKNFIQARNFYEWRSKDFFWSWGI